jgi:hypothetical protein
MDTLEVGGKLTAPDLNAGSTGRPASIQTRIDAGDFSHRP